MKLRHWLLIVPAVLALAYLNSRIAQADSHDKRDSIQVDGSQRTYMLHLPADYDGTKAIPLVLALHGRLGTGEGQERLSHFDKVSDEHGFVVAYPDGLERSWADGRGTTPADKSGINDVHFLSELISRLSRAYKIDTTRVYATGMSNGGFMSGRLACDLSGKIAGVAVVGAAISTNVAAACKPMEPISVLILQGTADPLVPFQGGEMGGNTSGGVILSHGASVQKFVELNHCTGSAKKEQIADSAGDGTTVEASTYSSCEGGSEVRSYVVKNGGHTWPGGLAYLPESVIGKTSKNLDASEVIWEFFARHSRKGSIAESIAGFGR